MTIQTNELQAIDSIIEAARSQLGVKVKVTVEPFVMKIQNVDVDMMKARIVREQTDFEVLPRDEDVAEGWVTLSRKGVKLVGSGTSFESAIASLAMHAEDALDA